MPSIKLIDVHGYISPDVFACMEEARQAMRRVSKSRFVEDAIVEKLERMGKYPPPTLAHEGHRRKKTAA